MQQLDFCNLFTVWGPVKGSNPRKFMKKLEISTSFLPRKPLLFSDWKCNSFKDMRNLGSKLWFREN